MSGNAGIWWTLRRWRREGGKVGFGEVVSFVEERFEKEFGTLAVGDAFDFGVPDGETHDSVLIGLYHSRVAWGSRYNRMMTLDELTREYEPLRQQAIAVRSYL